MNTRSILAFASLLLLAACSTPSPTSPDAMPSSSSSSSVLSDVTSSVPEITDLSQWTWDGEMLSGKHEAIISTSKGDIIVKLDADLAPKTVTNFMALAASGYYDKLTFHRVIPDFMIQGGDPSGNGTGGQSIFGSTFEDEINPKAGVYASGYKAGAIAMANRGPNTNGSQFFIMDKDYPLPPNYTIFGSVESGQEVVNAIARVDRDENDKPLAPVTFSVKVIK